MRFVVTGAAGFIGSTLCDRLLADGHDVLGVDSFTDYYARRIKVHNIRDALQHPAFQLLEADLVTATLTSAVSEAGGVFHLAAQPGVRQSWGEEFSVYVRDGILATQRVLEACRTARVPRVVYASSSSVYGNAESLPVAEDAPLRPISPYGISKHAGEELCRAYGDGFGMEVVVLRYFTVYGPRQRPDMAFHRFIKSALTGRSIDVYGDGSQTRDFTYVDDAVAGTTAAMDRGLPGAVYNLGGGARWAVRDILDAIQTIAGKPLVLQHLEAQLGDVAHTAADTTKARRELGFAPEMDVVSGLARQAQSLSDRLRNGLLD
ncbi:MAG: NAD-dependent epimerase/dehydratase family protein [Candidatus Dormibacteraeota bacterium]|nr:NAD-dependent epimerase/dehydratase family protein [Candidatus Dormibacteraeota bacterium]MBV9525172.1 NAD-dependent epimerase/dehydratase family protein [Candidatus Dormibacteraeota bacterium]